MSLRPLLRIAAEDERFRALATAVASGDGASVRASASIRPYLLAALLDDPDALAGRPALVVATDDIAARDLARDLGAYLAPRRVHHYPSRGLGYASNLTPAPHLVGLRIAALDALTGWIDAGDPPVVVASALALAEAIPDASLRPAGFSISHGEEIDLGDVTELLVAVDPSAINELRDRGLLAYHLKDFSAALRDLQAFLQLTSTVKLDYDERKDRAQIWEHVKTLRKRVASLN